MALRFNLLNRPSFKIAFIDVEASANGKKLLDFGALHESGLEFHFSSKQDFVSFVRDAEYLCGFLSILVIGLIEISASE